MGNTKFLYGASIQGIQSFIFQTNELKDIVGASELVEQICTTEFARLINPELRDNNQAYEQLKKDSNAILMAAGNIKYIFDDKAKCELIVLNFQKKIVEMAPGITVSQAVVEYTGADESTFEGAINMLENRLRSQRNKPMRSMTIGLTGMLRSRKTGLPAVKEIKGDYLDLATTKKRNEREKATLKLCENCFGIDSIRKNQVAFNIEDITGKNDWIAVIHADGNGLGQIVQQIGTSAAVFKKFSSTLNECTLASAQSAFNKVKYHFENKNEDVIPIRPIVLGGDDFTVICRASFAVEYVEAFLKEFESSTKERLTKLANEFNGILNINQKEILQKGLTACAGISFIKSSFPFYYGYNLSETLCTQAKKEAKEINQQLAPSCLMFHKVQDSFVEDYSSIEKRELTIEDISFKFGPYYTERQSGVWKDRWTIDDLTRDFTLMESKDGQAVKSNLREWITQLICNPGMAEQKLKRIKILLVANEKLLEFVDKVTDIEKKRIPIYDILSLYSVIYQDTKSNKTQEV